MIQPPSCVAHKSAVFRPKILQLAIRRQDDDAGLEDSFVRRRLVVVRQSELGENGVEGWKKQDETRNKHGEGQNGTPALPLTLPAGTLRMIHTGLTFMHDRKCVHGLTQTLDKNLLFSAPFTSSSYSSTTVNHSQCRRS